MDIDEVNQIVMFNQYLDVMRSMSESHNSKTVVLPASTPAGFKNLYDEVTNALLTGEAVSKYDGAKQ